HSAAAWIEELKNSGLTSGCSANPPKFCPEATVSRGEIAAFITRAFNPISIIPSPSAPSTAVSPTPTPTPIPGDVTDTGDTPEDEVNLYDNNKIVGSFGNPYTIFDYSALVANFGK